MFEAAMKPTGIASMEPMMVARTPMYSVSSNGFPSVGRISTSGGIMCRPMSHRAGMPSAIATGLNPVVSTHPQ